MSFPRAFQVPLVVKNLPASAGDVRDMGSIAGSGSFHGEGHGSPLQYSCLENPMDGEAWRAAVHGVAKSWTRLSDFHFTSVLLMFLLEHPQGWALCFTFR